MMINSVKVGQPVASKEKKITKSILNEAKEYVSVDMKKKLVFPNVIRTTLTPDIMLSSMISKAIVMIELTDPWEPDVTKPTRQRKQNTAYNNKIAKQNYGSAGCSL